MRNRTPRRESGGGHLSRLYAGTGQTEADSLAGEIDLDAATVPAEGNGAAKDRLKPPRAVNQPQGEQVGTVIGHYTLTEKLGEGGFGVVWKAKQSEPVKREVALKILKRGMDTDEVITRFEAERQALAVMDHPNIAKVHDAGATESGRPYFVMEFVAGHAADRLLR